MECKEYWVMKMEARPVIEIRDVLMLSSLAIALLLLQLRLV